MKFQPYKYQAYCIEKIVNNPVMACLISMGLGKTVITLTAIYMLMFEEFAVHKVLVVGPKRVVRDTWPEEIEKFDHLHGLKFSVVAGTPKQRLKALEANADLYLISRDSVDWLVNHSGTALDYDMLVIDELSSFKDHKTKRFKAMMKPRANVARVVGLTGSPASNGLMGLWAQFRLLDFGKRLCRTLTQYRDEYFLPDKRNAQVVFTYKLKPGAEERIYNAISDITISMTNEHLEMPELMMVDKVVELSEDEQQLYDSMKKDLVLSTTEGSVSAGNAGVLCGKLCQMSGGAVLGDDGGVIHIHDRKLEMLEQIVEEANGCPLLLCYWYQADYERIVALLQRLKVSFAKIDSSRSIQDWNAGRLAVGLLHPASCGHGLNLQKCPDANQVCWYSLPWSLELYEQANCRLFRNGVKSKTIVISHIICTEIDVQIKRALEQKDITQTALINAVKAVLED